VTGKTLGIVALISLGALWISGCSAKTSSPSPASRATGGSGGQSPSYESMAVAAQSLAMLVSQGATFSPTQATTSIDASAAVAAALPRIAETSSTVIGTARVRLTDVGAKNVVVWVVGAAPVSLRSHGPARAHKQTIGRAVVVVDASTGKVLESTEGGL
jgi:hypothetical protein